MMLHQALRKFLFILFAFFPSVGLALPSDQKQPYHVTADRISYFHKEHYTLYEGDVVATQGTTHLDGSKILVYYDGADNKITKILAFGSPAHYSTQPNEKPERLFAEAKTITYFPVQNHVLLVDQAMVTQNKNVFRGPHIWYDVSNQTVISTGGKQGQTTLVIEPQK